MMIDEGTSVNFVHPSMNSEGFHSTTVGRQILYYSELIASSENRVFVNGVDYQSIVVLRKDAQAPKPATALLRRLIGGVQWLRKSSPWRIFKDLKMLTNRVKIPQSYFLCEANNIIFQGPRLVSELFWKNYFITILFDEPPCLGVNVETRLAEKLLLRRLHRSLQQADKVWCYHRAAEEFLISLEAKDIQLLPCHLRSDDPSPLKKEGFFAHGDLEVVVVSTFLPWHGIFPFLESFAESEVGRLHLIGDGITYDQCVEHFGDHNRILFHGYQEQAKIAEILNECHVGVVPAIPWFNAPLKIIDYGFAGLACVSAYSEGVSSYYDKDEVILARGIEEIILALLFLRDNRACLYFHANKLNSRMHQEFTLDHYSKALVEILVNKNS